MPGWILCIVAIVRGWFTVKADIQQKQQEHTGEVVQENADLEAEVKADEAALKADADSLDETRAEKIEALREGQE